ncbi:MAG: BamA/TamA family outer membrane protein [Flavobacteriaceae bacterium]|nr:BamA/TamA family outer membrane protein [Flavobacteriaceae bacterium]
MRNPISLTRAATKISLFLGFILLCACSPTRRLAENDLWLIQNDISINGQPNTDNDVESLIIQKPNTRFPIIGAPLGVLVYNLAQPNPHEKFDRWLKANPKRTERLERLLSKKQIKAIDSSKINFSRWLKNTGSAPTIIDTSKAQKSLAQLKKYFYNQGYFTVQGRYDVRQDSVKSKRASVHYDLDLQSPYTLGQIGYNISSPAVDSLFKKTQAQSFLRPNTKYDLANFDNERARITIELRNSGLYYFDQDYVTFEADTNGLGHQVNVAYIIPDRRLNNGDTLVTTEPFKIYKVNTVRLITDHDPQNPTLAFTDSITYNGYEVLSYGPTQYRPKAITNAIAITPGALYRDIDRTLTYGQINELRNFKYPTINYEIDSSDSTGTGLISTILLSPQKKYTLGVDVDAYTSTIQQFGVGFSASYLIRNVFKGAENLEISASGSVGSSKDNANSDSQFFNTSDIGINARLTTPQLLFPINTQRLIPKYMGPVTTISSGINSQNNIGLDRQNFNGAFSYQWRPSSKRKNVLDLLNLQYVRNLNSSNYFNVYRNSYQRLNQIAIDAGYSFDSDVQLLGIPEQTNAFLASIDDPSNPYSFAPEVKDELIAIGQRKSRLTENNLILASNFTWNYDTRETLNDNSFSRINCTVELAGNLLSGMSSLFNANNSQGNSELFGVVFSQYAKFEIDYIRHWDLGRQNVFAFRSFGGWAAPYGNSSSIPFTRSYFAGGANDNRGWRAYDLGPGSSGSNLDFNEANFKLNLNAEYRFPIFGNFKGAFFTDIGNIWNLGDDVLDPAFQFNGLTDLKELAVATGIGLRYDFGFFVIRLDTGFKTHNPARALNNRWFKEYNFANAVYNIGINYPF